MLTITNKLGWIIPVIVAILIMAFSDASPTVKAPTRFSESITKIEYSKNQKHTQTNMELRKDDGLLTTIISGRGVGSTEPKTWKKGEKGYYEELKKFKDLRRIFQLENSKYRSLPSNEKEEIFYKGQGRKMEAHVTRSHRFAPSRVLVKDQYLLAIDEPAPEIESIKSTLKGKPVTMKRNTNDGTITLVDQNEKTVKKRAPGERNYAKYEDLFLTGKESQTE